MAGRRGFELPRLFTLGGRIPAAVGLILALMLAATVWGWMDRPLIDAARLAPVSILRGQVWRLVTWPFFQDNPFTLLFGGFMIWTLGQQLSYAWSEQRLVLRFLGYTVATAIGTTALAFVWEPASWVTHAGVWPVVNALLVAWAMLFPDRQVNFWGVLPLTGKMLALLVVFGTVLYALAGGWPGGFAAFSPHLIAIAVVWAHSRGLGGRRWFRDTRAWWERTVSRRRSRRFKVVQKGGRGPDDKPRWMN